MEFKAALSKFISFDLKIHQIGVLIKIKSSQNSICSIHFTESPDSVVFHCILFRSCYIVYCLDLDCIDYWQIDNNFFCIIVHPIKQHINTKK